MLQHFFVFTSIVLLRVAQQGSLAATSAPQPPTPAPVSEGQANAFQQLPIDQIQSDPRNPGQHLASRIQALARDALKARELVLPQA